MIELEPKEGEEDAIFLDPDLSEDHPFDGEEDGLPLEEAPSEGDALPDPDGRPEGSEEDEGSDEKEKGFFRKSRTGVWAKRLLLIPAAFALVLLGAFLKSEWLPPGGAAKKTDLLSLPREINHPIIDEKLAPFFVPLPAGSSNVAVRLDVTVRWDRLTSARFKNEESKIRTKVYQKLLKFAGSGKNFEDKTAFLEQEISGTMKKSLGVKDFELVIDEVKLI